MKRVAILSAAALALALAAAPGAEAAKPCGKERVRPDNLPARVAVVESSCETGLEVTADLYATIAEGQRQQDPPFWEVDSFRCLTGLASSEVWCHQHSSWVFATTRPDEHPATWHIPNRRPRPPYWRHCAPVPEVVNGDMLTHRVSCSSGRKLIHRVLVKSQSAQTSHIHALGFTCGLRPYAARAITCHKGAKRVLSPLAG